MRCAQRRWASAALRVFGVASVIPLRVFGARSFADHVLNEDLTSSGKAAGFSILRAVQGPCRIASPFAQQTRQLTIETSVTPNPDCKRFFSMQLSFLPRGKFLELPDASHAHKSKLAAALFAVLGVKSVYLADEYISVTKDATADWALLDTQIKEVLLAFNSSGYEVLSETGALEISRERDDTAPQPGDSDVVLSIKELIASRIRPMLVSDGGNVRYVGFEDATVYVQLKGACRNCPSSGATLKNGIQRMLMHWIPEVLDVIEVDEEWATDYLREQEILRMEREAEAAKGATQKDGKTADLPPNKEADSEGNPSASKKVQEEKK